MHLSYNYDTSYTDGYILARQEASWQISCSTGLDVRNISILAYSSLPHIEIQFLEFENIYVIWKYALLTTWYTKSDVITIACSASVASHKARTCLYKGYVTVWLSNNRMSNCKLHIYFYALRVPAEYLRA